jgi:hypothetical protein
MKRKLLLILIVCFAFGLKAQTFQKSNAKFYDFEIIKIDDNSFPIFDLDFQELTCNLLHDEIVWSWIKSHHLQVAQAIQSDENKITRNDYLKLPGVKQAAFTHFFSALLLENLKSIAEIHEYYYKIPKSENKVDRKTIIFLSKNNYDLFITKYCTL